MNWVDPNGENAIAILGASTVLAVGATLYLQEHPEVADKLWQAWNENQNEKRPKDCPTGTKDIKKVKGKYGWNKDQLHNIKKGAHGGMGTGKSWTGVAPDGTVGINEGGEWIPQGHWEDLQ